MKPFKMGITDLLEGQQDFQLPCPTTPQAKNAEFLNYFINETTFRGSWPISPPTPDNTDHYLGHSARPRIRTLSRNQDDTALILMT